MNECIFCEIIKKSTTTRILFEDESVLAFPDSNPLAPVHVLIIPKLRSELVHAERQFNLLSPGRFATTRLGRAVLRESFVGAMVASVCTFIGALIPMLASMIPNAPAWIGAVVAIAALALLGLLLGRAVYGKPTRWALGLAAAGIIVA